MNIKKIMFMFFFLMIIGIQETIAKSIVYFFIDFRFYNKEYMFKVDGKDGFTLKADNGKQFPQSDVTLWNMMARKVIFNNSQSHVVGVDCPSPRGTYHAEINLNLEDGETYYVLINAGLKKTFYMELLTPKEGIKQLNKAQKSKKYSFNEDFIYTGK